MTVDYAHVVILGCGLAGAGAAHQLPGARLFEANDHVGGHATSHPWQGFAFDEGAHISHTKDEDFLRRLGIGTRDDILTITSKTANWDRGRWLSYPVQNHLHQLPETEKKAALDDFLRAQKNNQGEPCNYLEWCRSQYGDYLTDTYYKRYTDKYWRTDMAEMDIDWLSGRLLPSQVERVMAGAIASQEEKQPVFAQFRYPREGGFMGLMRPLFDGLKPVLKERATSIDPKKRVVLFASGRSEHYEQLLSTLPLPTLIKMLTDVPASVREAAAKLRWTQLICVDFIVAKPKVVPWHWFYVYDNDIETSRVSVPSNLNQSQGNVSAIQAEIFRRDDEKFDAANLGEKAVGELHKVLGITADEVKDIRTKHIPYGYVVPFLGHAKTVAHILEWLTQQGIEAAGLHGRWKYVWSDAAFRSGEAAADAIKAGNRS